MKVFIGPYPKGRSKAKRKISVRIDGYDTWSLDHTLAYIILPCLKQIRKRKRGAPGRCFDYSHHETMKWHSPEFNRAEAKSSKAGFKKWADLLDAMIWSFDQVVRDGADEPDITKNKKAYMAYQTRVSEGLKVFGDYYQALWT